MLLQVSVSFLVFCFAVDPLFTSGHCYCNSCYYQMQCENFCRTHCSTIPGSCWLFQKCVQAACQNGGNLNSCFNGVCNAGENVENCPCDCCASRNAEKCTLVSGVCPPQCCGDSNCCVEKKSKSKVGMVSGCICGIAGCCCIAYILYRVYKHCTGPDPTPVVPISLH